MFKPSVPIKGISFFVLGTSYRVEWMNVVNQWVLREGAAVLDTSMFLPPMLERGARLSNVPVHLWKIGANASVTVVDA